MVAYSFKRRFVNPIRAGLDPASKDGGAVYVGSELHNPKRQTIRADRRRHVRPGEEIQLFCGMRTRDCFLIGRARCVEVEPIYIEIERPLVWVGKSDRMRTLQRLNEFARRDGFEDYKDFAMFWYEEHHESMNDFHGVIIRWEPLDAR